MAVADLVTYQYRETGGAGAATIVGASFVTIRGETPWPLELLLILAIAFLM